MIGVSYYIKSNPGDDSMTERLRNMAYQLIGHYHENEAKDWHWFESLLAYDNGILPLALLHSAEILNDDKINEIAITSREKGIARPSRLYLAIDRSPMSHKSALWTCWQARICAPMSAT